MVATAGVELCVLADIVVGAMAGEQPNRVRRSGVGVTATSVVLVMELYNQIYTNRRRSSSGCTCSYCDGSTTKTRNGPCRSIRGGEWWGWEQL